MSNNKKFFSIISKYYKDIFIVIILLSLFVLSQTMIPFLVGRYINSISSISSNNTSINVNYNISDLTKVITVISSLLIFGSISCYFHEYLLAVLIQKIVSDLRIDMYMKINTLPVNEIESRKVGYYVQLIITDIENINASLNSIVKQFLQGIIRIIITTIFMFCTNWFLSICVIVLSPLSLLVSRFVAKTTLNSFNKTRDNTTDLISHSMEGTSNIDLIQSLNYQNESLKTFDQLNEKLKKSSILSQFSSSWTNPITRLINGLIYALIGITGISLVYFNLFTLQIGDISAFLTYTNGYTKPFNDISSVIGEYETFKVAINNINAFLNMKDDIDSNVELENKIELIQIKNLTFSYNGVKNVLSDISFDIKEKEKVALVGQTGSGKTTLVSLLLRFYEPTSGKILINNKDISTINKKSLRDNIGMVLQDSWIFNGSIKENINYCGNRNDEEIINLCNKIKANIFIEEMRDKYDTIISSNSSISDGQKQIISIARVLLDNNNLIILDEATSNIDTLSESIIQDAFNSLTKNKTSIIIAHRLSTIVSCDKIVALKDGKIIEIGNHKNLIAKKGYYYHLYKSQFQK